MDKTELILTWLDRLAQIASMLKNYVAAAVDEPTARGIYKLGSLIY